MKNQQFITLLLIVLVGVCSAATQAKRGAHGIAPVEQPPNVKKDTKGVEKGFCSVLSEGQYLDTPTGWCFGAGDSSWNEKMTSIRSTLNTCIQVWMGKDSNQHEEYCGDDWIQLSDLSENVSRVCCIASDAQIKKEKTEGEAETEIKAKPKAVAVAKARAAPASGGTHAPLVVGCNGDGGSCTCGVAEDGTALKMNHFFGNINAERVNGCQSNFQLSGSMWKSQWRTGSTAAAESIGFDFEQQTAHYGLEGMFSLLVCYHVTDAVCRL